MMRPWLAAAALAALAVSGGFGYRMGQRACTAAHDAARLAQIEAGRKLDEARRQAARERDLLARQLEEQAYADPVLVERCLGPDRVRRLNAYR